MEYYFVNQACKCINIVTFVLVGKHGSRMSSLKHETSRKIMISALKGQCLYTKYL